MDGDDAAALLHKDKDLSTNQLFTNPPLMANMATLNTAKENTNNCGKIKYQELYKLLLSIFCKEKERREGELLYG